MKKLFFGFLLCFGLLFTSFSSAGSYTFSGIATSSTGIPNMYPPQLGNNKNMTVHCYFESLLSCDGGGTIFSTKFSFGFLYSDNPNGVFTNQTYNSTTYSINCGDDMTLTYDYDFSTFSPTQEYYQPYNGVYAFKLPTLWIHNAFQILYSCTFSGVSVIDGNNYSNSSTPSCPEINTGEILSGYILESSIDNLYCESNGLCPLIDTGIVGSGNWSSLYINGIQHDSRSTINVFIPDYIYWDYTISDDDFDLDIGTGYDQDYINGVIDVQSYRPSSEDFTQTFVGGLILFTPYVVILLFVILVWNLIKRIFRSK